MGFAKVGIASLLVVAAQGGHDFTPEVFIVYPMQVVLSLNPSDSKYTTGLAFGGSKVYFPRPRFDIDFDKPPQERYRAIHEYFKEAGLLVWFWGLGFRV